MILRCQDQDDCAWTESHLSAFLVDVVGELVKMLGATRDQCNPIAQLPEQTTGGLISSPCIGFIEEGLVLTLKKPLSLCGSQDRRELCKHGKKHT